MCTNLFRPNSTILSQTESRAPASVYIIIDRDGRTQQQLCFPIQIPFLAQRAEKLPAHLHPHTPCHHPPYLPILPAGSGKICEGMYRNEEGQGFARTCFGCPKDISATESLRKSKSLDSRQLYVVCRFQSFFCILRKR